MIATESWAGGGVPSNRLAWICGLLAFVVVAQLLDPPPAARGEAREVGAWLALGGSALMVAGAVLAMAQISVTIDVTERERRQRMAAVDARDDDGGDEPGSTAPRSAGSGLWQAPSAPGAAEADGERESARDPRAPGARERRTPEAEAPDARQRRTPEAEAPDARQRRAPGAGEPDAKEPEATSAKERQGARRPGAQCVRRQAAGGDRSRGARGARCR